MTNYLIIAVAIAIISFIMFRWRYLRGTMRHRAMLIAAAFIVAIPAVLFFSNYLLGVPCRSWFYYFHSVPGIEASSGLVGALLGVVFGSERLRPSTRKGRILIGCTVMAVLLLITPFGKQLFLRLDYSQLEDRWVKGVCRQTSLRTCMPASCATVIRMLGGNVTERELAIDAGSNGRGTEMWYMMRAMRKHGYEIEVRDAKSVRDAPVPSILGVKLGMGGHVVVLMSKNEIGPEIGNPLGTRLRYTWEEFEETCHPSRVYFVIRPIGVDADSE